jgi:hypothetical protein
VLEADGSTDRDADSDGELLTEGLAAEELLPDELPIASKLISAADSTRLYNLISSTAPSK